MLAGSWLVFRLGPMEPRVTHDDLALLLLSDEELMTLGAMLSLPARSVDLGAEWGEGEERGPDVPAPQM